MTDDTYQGWTNRETWCVALWLNNEQALQEGARSACNTDSEMVNEAARTLEDYVEELLEDEALPGMMRDLINCCLARVDWAEIVGTFRE